jgi:hypothetical protein
MLTKGFYQTKPMMDKNQQMITKAPILPHPSVFNPCSIRGYTFGSSGFAWAAASLKLTPHG